ncbi:GNAT family N-acetyltransferase [Actinosynnema sp. NPDC020468]|uniref:GNAT family N-acetyltransferase n=1 Tax=Actinosynnema sp. NPDC020468 TaxID=3154488 RepID=UPI0033EBFCF4
MDPWPFTDLVLTTPRLELRPDDDAGLRELADVAAQGVHDPAVMPFGFAWTDLPEAELGIGMLQFHWGRRAALRAADWTLNFVVRMDARVVGMQSVSARDFAQLREVDTGSWLGLRYQGVGIGTEMRAAVLLFAFDHLGAHTARSSAFTDNPASIAVSRKLGYRENGTYTLVRRGQSATNTRFALTNETFVRPDWVLRVEGATPCVPLLM